MCDPLTMMAVAAGTSAVVGVKSAIDGSKARKAAASQAKKAAAAEKRKADAEALASRKDEYSSRRVAKPNNPMATAGSLFSPRSFFSPV